LSWKQYAETYVEEYFESMTDNLWTTPK